MRVSSPPPLQRLEESGAWQRVNTQVPIRSPRYAVFDLAEGKQYRFRVLSANMYGCSEPSEPTGPIETQELKGASPSASSLRHAQVFLQQWDKRWYRLQVCPLLPVRWLPPGRQTLLSSSSGLHLKNPTIWLATTSISAWRGPRTGSRPITNLTRTPSTTKNTTQSLLSGSGNVRRLTCAFCRQVCGQRSDQRRNLHVPCAGHQRAGS